MKFRLINCDSPYVRMMYLCSLRPGCKFHTLKFNIALAYQLNKAYSAIVALRHEVK